MRASSSFALALLLAGGCGDSREIAVSAVPPLPGGLPQAEAAIREDLEARHRQLASTAADPQATATARAVRFGELGISLLAHGFFAEAVEGLRRASELAPSEFRWHYYLGQSIRRTGDAGAAANAFLAALALEENNLPARLWLAEALLDREQLDEAEAAFARALELRPHCAQALTGLGRIALSRGDNEKALTLLESALEQEAESPRARYALALALRALGRLEEARSELTALEGRDHSRILTCFEDPWMREVRRRQTGTRGHEERARRAIEERRPAAALVELRAAARANPNRFPARHDVANLLLQMGRVEEARDELEALLGERPDYAAALSMLAGIEAREGRWPAAENLLERAVAADPESEAIRLERATILHSAGRTAAALAAYEEALEISPTLVPAILGHSACLAQLGRLDEALEQLEKRALELPSRPAIILARACLLLTTGSAADGAEALSLAREVVAQRPTIGGALVLAAALTRSGQQADAAIWRTRAVDSMPDESTGSTRRARAQTLFANVGAGQLDASFLDPTGLTLLMIEDPLATTEEPTEELP